MYSAGCSQVCIVEMSSGSMTTCVPQGLKDIVNPIVVKWRDGSDVNTQVVQYKDDILEACENFGFMHTRLMHVKWMGVHPSNRDGELLSATRANTRVHKLWKGGCSLKTLEGNLVGIEDNPLNKQIERTTLDMCSRSPLFAVYKPGDIKAGTLGAGHVTHGFAQVHDQRPCDIADISENGCMSQQILFKDNNIKQAVTCGMNYKILRWEIESEFPDVPRIIQAALNTVQQVAEGSNEPANQINDSKIENRKFIETENDTR